MGAVVRLAEVADNNGGQRAKAAPVRFMFTERKLAALERPTSGCHYVYDALEAGLCVRLTPTKGAFVFYRWHRGKPDRITIDDVGAIQLRQARAIVAGYRGDLARGVDVFAAARRAKHEHAEKPLTLADAFARHISRPDMRPSTLRDYVSLWRRVPARMKSRAITDITPDELERLHSAVAARRPRTANKLLALVSVLCRRAGRRHDNPATGIERTREEPRQRVLTIDELRRLRRALEVESEPWRSFFLLLMLTGSRRGALARMQWADLDLDASTWRIPAMWAKSRKVIAVALPDEAVAVLRELHAESGASDWVFPSRSKTGHLTEPKKAWARVCKRGGVTNAVIHDLRRTVGTLVAADGAGAPMIAAVLGHLSLQSAKSYLHLSTAMTKDAVERVARRTTGAA